MLFEWDPRKAKSSLKKHGAHNEFRYFFVLTVRCLMCDEELEMSRYEYSEAETQRLRAMMGREVTIGMAHSHIEYFGKIGAEYGLSAERVMAIYLRHMVYSGYKVNIDLPKVVAPVGDFL